MSSDREMRALYGSNEKGFFRKETEVSNQQPATNQQQSSRDVGMNQIAAAIVKAKPEQLVELDKQIAEAELAIAALRDLRKLIARRTGAETSTRKAKSTMSAYGGGIDWESKIVEYVKKNGPAKPMEIAVAIGTDRGSVGRHVRSSHDLIKNVNGEVELT